MGVTCFEHEITSPVPPAKIFKASVLESDTVLPKVVPHLVKCVEIIQGDGGPGTIKKIHFSPDGGSIYKNKIKYHTKKDVDLTEHANGGKEEGIVVFKAIEAYVIANPGLSALK